MMKTTLVWLVRSSAISSSVKQVMAPRQLAFGLLLTSLLLSSPSSSLAQSSNGTVTLLEETISSAGERVGGGNPVSVVVSMGDPIGGSISGIQYIVATGYPVKALAPLAGTKEIDVEGDTTEVASTVVVNGISASLNGMHFKAQKVLLREGPNTITTTATDLAGNNSNRSITVSLDTHPPARPTIAGTPPLSSGTSYTLTGTKTKATSVWINGTQAVALGDLTSWSYAVPLVEGDNTLVVITKDAAGNSSSTNTVNIVVDNLPPVITSTSPSKTNFNPFGFTGTVDDSLTSVVVNGVTATRQGKTFQANIPLNLGSNTVTVTATSPNGYVTTRQFSLILGRIPTIQSVQPADGTLSTVGAALFLQISAIDPESDPIQYQMLLDGIPFEEWSATSSTTWVPTTGNTGLHVLTFSAKDNYGGSANQDVEVFIVRQPVPHP